MTPTLPSTERRHRTPRTGELAQPPSGPVARIIAASVAAGLVVAVVLVAVVWTADRVVEH